MMELLQISQKFRFIAHCVPGMRQPSLQVRLSMQRSTPITSVGLLTQLSELISVHLPAPVTAGPEVPADALPSHQFTSIIGQCYVWIMRGCGIPVFDRTLVHDVEPLDASVFLPCPVGLHQPAAAVLRWLLDTANLVLANQPLEPSSKSLAVLVKKLCTQAPPGINTIRFLESAYTQGIPVQRITGTTYQYGWGARARWFDSSFTDVTPTISSNLARDKFATSNLLLRAGLPVPKHHFAASEEDAIRKASLLGYPVVVKPSDKDGGVGVFAGLQNDAQVITAFRAASEVSKKILVEKHFEGNDYRLQVLNGKVFWAVHRVPGGVVGDGSSSIEQLLALVNAEPLRGARGSSALLKQIDLDDEALELLAQNGLTPESVPAADAFVRLRRAANVASGGRPVPILEHAHPDNLELAERAARILRLDLAGIDLLIPDIRQSWLKSGAAICEVNAQPQLSPHLPGLILEKLVKGRGRIPVVLVIGGSVNLNVQAGLRLCTSVSRSGLVVGFASRQRSFVGSPPCVLGIHNAMLAADALLLDSRVEVAVICLDEADLIKKWLPVDQCSAMVLLGNPAAQAGAYLTDIQNIVGVCSGAVYCEMPPASWGLTQGQQIQRASIDDAIQRITSMASPTHQSTPLPECDEF